MTNRWLVLVLLGCAPVACSHPRPEDTRSALFSSVRGAGNPAPVVDQPVRDGAVHGSVSMESGFGSGRGYGYPGSGVSPDGYGAGIGASGLGTAGIGSSGIGTMGVPGGL